MATLHYTKRAQDALDINLVVEFYLSKITSACKGAVVHAVSEKIDRLVKAKKTLESKLESIADRKKGIFNRLKVYAAARKTKSEITIINNRLVDWLNMVYTYFLSK